MSERHRSADRGQVVGLSVAGNGAGVLPGLKQVMSVRGGYVGVRGVIVGGGSYDDGPGRLGVWLEHNPADFGVLPASFSRPVPPDTGLLTGSCGRGFTEAWLTDLRMTRTTFRGSTTCLRADRPADHETPRAAVD